MSAVRRFYGAALHRVGAVETADLVSRLTLLALLLEPVGFWALRPWILGLAAVGVLSGAVRRHPLTWYLLAALTAYRVLDDWPMADNHAYLLAYWCLAIALARSLGLAGRAGTADEILRLNGRWMLGLVFAFAVLWKAFLSPDYVDGTFFRMTFLTDDRFAAPAVLFGGVDESDLDAAREALRPLPPGASLLDPPAIPESPRLRRLALLATWGTLIHEALLAFAFLLPQLSPRLLPQLLPRRILRRCRDGLLLVFCVLTYPLAPVFGFGWLLLSLGLAQCEPSRARTRLAYLVVFVVLILLHDLPWAEVLVERGIRL